jgi:hypothetical protein
VESAWLPRARKSVAGRCPSLANGRAGRASIIYRLSICASISVADYRCKWSDGVSAPATRGETSAQLGRAGASFLTNLNVQLRGGSDTQVTSVGDPPQLAQSRPVLSAVGTSFLRRPALAPPLADRTISLHLWSVEAPLSARSPDLGLNHDGDDGGSKRLTRATGPSESHAPFF